LHLEDLDKPYFIQYGVDDTVTHRVAPLMERSEFGSQSLRVLHSQVAWAADR
jgi:hypothetical protein